MKNFLLILACAAAVAACAPAHAGTSIDVRNSDGTVEPIRGAGGQITPTLGACEDEPNSACRVEMQFSYQTPVAVDTQVKPAPGFVQMMKCMPQDNASVAGTIQLRDSLSAAAGTIVEEWVVLAVNYTLEVPIEFPVGKIFTTGIYLDFTTTSDIKCDVSYR